MYEWTDEKKYSNDYHTIQYKMAIEKVIFSNFCAINHQHSPDDYHITIFDELPFRKSIQQSKRRTVIENFFFDYNNQHNFDYDTDKYGCDDGE